MLPLPAKGGKVSVVAGFRRIVVFRSAKESPFAERRPPFRRRSNAGKSGLPRWKNLQFPAPETGGGRTVETVGIGDKRPAENGLRATRLAKFAQPATSRHAACF